MCDNTYYPVMNTRLEAKVPKAGTLESLRQAAFLDLVRTAATVEHAFEEGLKPYGVTLTQYNVLRILRGAGEDGLCRNEVKARMVKAVPDATRLLDRLEAAGYVERRRDNADRRFVTARITPAGLELLARTDGPVIELHADHLGQMAAPELRQLSTLLERARSTLE